MRKDDALAEILFNHILPVLDLKIEPCADIFPAESFIFFLLFLYRNQFVTTVVVRRHRWRQTYI